MPAKGKLCPFANWSKDMLLPLSTPHPLNYQPYQLKRRSYDPCRMDIYTQYQ